MGDSQLGLTTIMPYLGDPIVALVLAGIAVLAFWTLYRSRRRTALAALQLLLLVGFLASISSAVFLPREQTVMDAPVGAGLYSVELPQDVRVEAGMRFHSDSLSPDVPYRFTLFDADNRTVFLGAGLLVRESGYDPRGWLTPVVRLHFDVSAAGTYVILIELDSESYIDTVRITTIPQWIDRTVSVLLVMFGPGLLTSSLCCLAASYREDNPLTSSPSAPVSSLCSLCGARNLAGAAWCAFCGSPTSAKGAKDKGETPK